MKHELTQIDLFLALLIAVWIGSFYPLCLYMGQSSDKLMAGQLWQQLDNYQATARIINVTTLSVVYLSEGKLFKCSKLKFKNIYSSQIKISSKVP